MVQLLRAAVNGGNCRNCTTVVLGALALVAGLAALAPREARAQFASGIRLIEVYASVADRDGEPIRGLTAADFTVTEDGGPQQITTFAAGEFPLSVALAIDRSFSMAGERLAAARRAGRGFLDALRPVDQVMLVTIGSETEVAAPLSTRHEQAIAALDRLDAWGTTPLYDAMLLAIDAIEPAAGRRALVLVSDGQDRSSRASATDVVEYARRRDVLVYPIAIGKARPPIFAEIAGATGGRSFFVRDVKQLQGTLAAIARDLRWQYLLGYTPPHDAAPAWHAINVQVDRPDASVHARDGYFGR